VAGRDRAVLAACFPRLGIGSTAVALAGGPTAASRRSFTHAGSERRALEVEARLGCWPSA